MIINVKNKLCVVIGEYCSSVKSEYIDAEYIYEVIVNNEKRVVYLPDEIRDEYSFSQSLLPFFLGEGFYKIG